MPKISHPSNPANDDSYINEKYTHKYPVGSTTWDSIFGCYDSEVKYSAIYAA